MIAKKTIAIAVAALVLAPTLSVAQLPKLPSLGGGSSSSSGGDAVAVATGMVAAGLGNDYGGSLRLPAHAAGIVALRPSAGRVTSPSREDGAPVPLSLQAFAVNGPLARSVDDLDAVFTVIHGADDRDPLSVTVPHPSSYEGPRRAAITVDPCGWGVEPQVVDAVRRAADALSAAGWDVEEVDPPLVDRAATLWRQLSATEMAPLFEPGALPGPLSADTVRYFHDNVAGVELLDTSAAYQAAWAERFAIASAWSFQDWLRRGSGCTGGWTVQCLRPATCSTHTSWTS